jgi:hypothetical protein
MFIQVGEVVDAESETFIECLRFDRSHWPANDNRDATRFQRFRYLD